MYRQRALLSVASAREAVTSSDRAKLQIIFPVVE